MKLDLARLDSDIYIYMQMKLATIRCRSLHIKMPVILMYTPVYLTSTTRYASPRQIYEYQKMLNENNIVQKTLNG